MKTLLLGDLSPTVKTDPLFEKGDIETLMTDTVSLFKNNDINFVNLECAITESDHKILKYGPNLKTVPNTANVLKELGVTCCGLSNNHIFDFGIPGAEDSIRALEKVGIDYTGFGLNYEESRKNYVVEKNGEKVCIIAVCEHEYSYALEDRMGSRPYDEYHTIEDIRDAKQHCDRVIVIYHGGKELCRYPSPRLHKACHTMARAGADVILCQHTHCISCYEKYDDCHILYGQGNFHFVKPDFAIDPDVWNNLLAVKYDTKSHEIEFVPIVNSGNGITLAKGEEKEKIMSDFEKRNAELLNGEWKKGWHGFCESVANNYINLLKRSFSDNATEHEKGFMGHYLDCEAHNDVLREIFPTYNQTNEK